MAGGQHRLWFYTSRHRAICGALTLLSFGHSTHKQVFLERRAPLTNTSQNVKDQVKL